MKDIRFFYAPDAAQSNSLPEEEAHHAVRVLRLNVNDNIYITDGKGHLYTAKITEADNRNCRFEILDCQEQSPSWNGHLHIAMAPTKNIDRTEWFVEKATEIGIDRLSFLKCAFSERTSINAERIERIFVSAMKQSHKLTLPQFDNITKFSDFITLPFEGRKFIAHCYDQPELNPEGKPFLLDALAGNQEDALVLIGPEGDFSVNEVTAAITAGYIPISLGESRLRTETAALVAIHMMNINNRKKDVCKN